MKNATYSIVIAAVFVIVSYGVKTDQIKEVYIVSMLLAYIGCFLNLQFIKIKDQSNRLADIIANVWFVAGLCTLSLGALYGIRIVQDALKAI